MHESYLLISDHFFKLTIPLRFLFHLSPIIKYASNVTNIIFRQYWNVFFIATSHVLNSFIMHDLFLRIIIDMKTASFRNVNESENMYPTPTNLIKLMFDPDSDITSLTKLWEREGGGPEYC